MSFSSKIKEETAAIMPKGAHCLEAELFAMIRFCAKEQKKGELLFESESASAAKKYLKLLGEALGIRARLLARGSGRSRRYIILAEKNRQEGARLRDAGSVKTEQTGEKKEETEQGRTKSRGREPWRLAEEWRRRGFALPDDAAECCKRSYIRGAFQAAGSMSDPGKSYHFEIICPDARAARDLCGICKAFEIEGKTVSRKGREVFYIKDSARIADMLTVMEAHCSLLSLENTRIVKEMKNNANRQYNCDSANINKTVRSSSRQAENIRFILGRRRPETLPPQLKEMALIRLRYPDASLEELGEYLDPPVGKSGVNHRLRKLEEMARELRDELD